MSNIIIKTDERREHEEYVMLSFHKDGEFTQENREAAECIAARSRDAYNALKKMEGNS